MRLSEIVLGSLWVSRLRSLRPRHTKLSISIQTQHIWKALRQLLFPSAMGGRHWTPAEYVSAAIRPRQLLLASFPFLHHHCPLNWDHHLIRTAFTLFQPVWSSKQPSVCSKYTAMKHMLKHEAVCDIKYFFLSNA